MNQKSFWIIVFAVLCVLIAGYVVVLQPGVSPTDPVMTEDVADAAHKAAEPENTIHLDKDLILSERIMGNPDAPVRISEHSSFTCSHCGTFHRDTFDTLRAEYIDTGRAYLVFSDFPLNAPALHASVITRCAPEAQYFDFVAFLFKTQDDWAYDSGYLSYLKTHAAAYGLDEDMFAACLQDESLQKGLLERMKAAQNQWDIRSTPTLVINNKTVISGALPFEELDRKIQDAVEPPSETPAQTEEQPPEAPAAPDALMQEIQDMSEQAEQSLPEDVKP